jgi:hypothetical protein
MDSNFVCWVVEFLIRGINYLNVINKMLCQNVAMYFLEAHSFYLKTQANFDTPSPQPT